MRFYLAPMEGITTYIYRNAYYKYYGGMDAYYTPFVSNRKLKTRALKDVLPENNQAKPVIPQILTNCADVFLDIARQLKDMGYREVNLNLGCPSATVVTKHRGAGFLGTPKELADFLDTVFEKCPLNISIKTRLGVESLQEWENLLLLYRQFPIKELIIHARLLKDYYNGEPHMEAFRLAQQMLSCPLCYNGEIRDGNAYKRLLKECPDTQAVMLGRGAIANPLLVRELRSVAQEGENGMIDTTFRDFHNELLMNYRKIMPGEQPVLYKMKELWTYWNMHYDTDPQLLKKVRKAQRITEYENLLSLSTNLI